MEHGLVQTQSQRLMLTQKMQQAIQILQLSGIELEQYVQEELEQNPTLEVTQKQPEPEQPKNGENTVKDETDTFDAPDNDLDRFANDWSELRRTGPDMSRNADADARRDFYENSITGSESFTALLLKQLRLATKDDQSYAIGELIVGDIDAKGYFTGSLEKIAEETGAPLEDVEAMLSRIQRFEPTGVGARDVVECLLLQINVEYPDNDLLRTLVADHLEALERRQIPKIAKAMKISTDEVEALRTQLAQLNPWPGHEFSTAPPQYVTPDVIIEKVDGEYEAYLQNDWVPELRVNQQYQKLMRQKGVEKDAKKYLQDKVDSAKWLIRNIEQRQRTILRIAKAILNVQKGFMEKGEEAIKPLTLQEIADEVGVHEATVSRTTRGKYMQTPQGLFEMKYFFSPGLRRDTGEAQSSKSVQAMIKKIIEAEDKAKPLSDQKIADLLKAEGLKIARRTVTKYREGMGILATTMRKTYQSA
jgi:RNA polymerase sigma-54 factor